MIRGRGLVNGIMGMEEVLTSLWNERVEVG